jgi:thiamine-phosphate pyrophosphorylase
MKPLPRLYAIADAAFGNPIHLAEALLAGGAELIQVRDKAANTRTLLDEVEEVMKLALPERRIIVNDRADVARLAGAAGVHLGQGDLSPGAARAVLSAGQIVGVSTHTMEQALAADREEVNYIAAGPVFATTTKSNPDPVIGLEGLREICSRVGKPVVAIGGITLDRAADVLACGAASVAVIGDLLRHKDVAMRTREWLRTL